MPFLSRHFQVYTLDMHGFGRGRGQPFVLGESARVVKLWMDKTGLERAHLVGHSLGGYVATEFALEYPDQTRKIVLVDALPLPVGRTYLQHGVGLMRALRYMPLDFLPVLVTDALQAGPRTLSEGLGEIQAADLSERLSRLEVPSLVVWGEHDRVLPLELGKALHQALGARIEVIRGAGHNPMWDRPAEFNYLLLQYLMGTTGSEGRDSVE